MVLENLEPKSVFYHFERLCGIPHGSGNEKGVSDYCVEFAKAHGLKYIRDGANNVIIFKSATAGCEQKEPVILQGHLDMVCAVRKGADIDMATTPLKLKLFGDSIGAEDTSLGGDDGIAVAYALALLESEDIPHPPLEVILTTDEEVGMSGAAAIDLSALRGRRLINLDSEEQGIFTVGCAGGLRVYTKMPIERVPFSGLCLRLSVEGLIGGHSGVEINRGRANSNICMGALLDAVSTVSDLRICYLQGGDKDNVITPSTEAIVMIEEGRKEAVFKAVKDYKKAFDEKYGEVEKSAVILCEETNTELLPLDKDSSKRLVGMLSGSPFGVQKMNPDIEGLVQTSLNLGVLRLDKDSCQIDYSVRSSVTSERDELADRLVSLAEKQGATAVKTNPYPAWEYRKDSPLRDTMAEVWEEMTGEKPIICTIHAGLECGLLGEKIEGLDAVSIGPDMSGIHSPEERLYIKSVGTVWEFLKKTLAAL